jgi:hypothetical protein
MRKNISNKTTIWSLARLWLATTIIIMACGSDGGGDDPTPPPNVLSSNSEDNSGGGELSSSSEDDVSSSSVYEHSSSSSIRSIDGYFKYYDSDDESQRCQNGVVEGKCENKWYKMETHLCSVDLVEVCCDKTLANFLATAFTQLDIALRGGQYRCKEGIIEIQCEMDFNWYNRETHICIDNTPRVIDEYYLQQGLQRCGNRWYSPSEYQRCQNGTLESKCGNNWYNTSSHTCSDDGKIIFNSLVGSYDCGKGNYFPINYDNPEQRCQDGVVEYKCGNNWYNTNSHSCKNGILKARTRCGA